MIRSVPMLPVSLALLAASLTAAPVDAQVAAPRPAPMARLSAPYDSSAFAALTWREIGPFRGGRSVAVAGSATRPAEYYMGTTGGGVFKSTDGGMTWAAITDKFFGGTIGAIGVSESNPDIVYVGTGEYPIRGNVSHGDGVFKSTDAGKTWTSVGLADSRQISRVRVHPRDPNVVYVGVQGNVWGPSATRGVFRTKDGGKNWQKVLFKDDSTGVSDLVMDPANPDVLYAALWTAYRKPWMLVSGGPGSGIYKSMDGGNNWKELTRNAGLPKGVLGNIGISVSRARPNRVWAIIEADSGGVFRSDDGGSTWTKTNAERKLRQRAWYYTKIHADSKDENTVYVNNVSFQRSTDGGKTFKAIRTPHGDSHDLWISPTDNQRMIEGNDGGGTVSTNAGKTWTEEDYATAQFYHVTTTTHFPYRVCGAQQDNSTLCGPSRYPGGIGIGEWYDAGGGESGYIAARPDNPDITYAGSYGGYLTRKDARTGFERDINPWPMNPMGHSAGDVKYRFQWTFPIVLSPHDPNTLYAGANVLFRSASEGQRWTPISGDLTRHDPKTLGPSGGPLTKDQTSVEYYGTIFAVAESPVTRGVIWTGSDDGVVQVTRDAGRTWTKLTPDGLPEFARISSIEASRRAAGTAYLAANRFQMNDMAPYLYRTTDYGRTWTKIVDGIAPTEFTRVLREDPVKAGLLYAGTERGVWVSFDDGASWQKLQRNLPIVPVHDLAIADGDLVAATHGRSFWILDDLSALRQITPALAQQTSHLFKPRDAWRVGWGGGGGTGATGGHPAGANPPSGATVYYWVKDSSRTVTLDFLDAKGALIRSFTSRLDSIGVADSLVSDSVKHVRADSLRKAGITADSIKTLEAKSEESAPPPGDDDGPRRAPRAPRVPNKRGLNAFTWNLRYPDATFFAGMIFWAGGTTGPMAPPGAYAVRMTVDGDTASRLVQRFAVKKDPRSPATSAELTEQFAFLMKIRDRVTAANDAVRTIRNVKAQLADRTSRIPAANRARVEVISTVMRERLERIEGEIYQVRNQSSQDPLNYPIRLNNKIGALAGVVASADARPTDQAYSVFTILSMDLDKQLIYLREALAQTLPPLNAALKQAGQTEIVPSTAELKVPGAAMPAGGDEESADPDEEQR